MKEFSESEIQLFRKKLNETDSDFFRNEAIENYLTGVKRKESKSYYKKVIEKYSHTELKNAAIYRLGWSRMRENKWREASETFSIMEKNSPLYMSSRVLSQKSLEGEQLPRPGVEGSDPPAVLPGDLGEVAADVEA